MGKPSRRPTEDSIRLRAYELWQEKGCPMGDDKTDWLEAERQLSPEPPERIGGERFVRELREAE